ncbi:MAG TPA: carboxypeptidase regulatory-like domain-containing protein, partial [Terriglobia bacterium]|nr:carboxypeptidase regulatory-like domain-containing protein [Terriglobia bacterium]
MKRRCRLYPCLGIGLIFIALSAPSMAQVQNASLTGLVADPSGAVVRSAMVTIKNSATNVTFTQETDASGYYFFPALPIGAYTVSVEMAGFKKAVHNIILEVGQRGRDDFHLEVGGITETVEVESAPSALETQQPAPNTVIQNRMVLEIPLSARNWDDLLQTVPGVAGDRYTEQGGSTAAGRTGGINVHGVRSLQNNFLLDGVDNNTVSENVQELSTQIVHTSVDAIEEFKVTTAPYSPEYGRSPGAAITVATRGGSNHVHGTAWEFLRNDKFDATDFFLNRSGVKKAKNRQNQFGANVGGPIIKDRAFFFFNYEGTRIVRGQTRLTNVPMPNERIGDFSAEAAAANRTTYANIFDNVGDCIQKAPSAFSSSDPLGATHFANNKIPAACLDPVGQNIVALLPMPNLVPGAGALNTNNYLRVPSLLDNNDSYTTKGDAQIDPRQHLFVRYVYSNRFRFVP